MPDQSHDRGAGRLSVPSPFPFGRIRLGASQSKSLPAIGFLTVATIPNHGLVGGYLLLNAAARPIEFHCTAPVRANRAQEILYGPTLRPYLYGEQIGQTLLARSKTKPLLAVTDIEDVLAARQFTAQPVIFILPPTRGDDADADADREIADAQGTHTVQRASSACRSGCTSQSVKDNLVEFSLGGQRVAVSESFQKDQQIAKQCWQASIGRMDLREPFQRIHDAIHETQGGGH